MTYYRGATEAGRLANAEADGYERGFRAGQEEMRERAALECEEAPGVTECDECAEAIRALPVLSGQQTTKQGDRQ